MHNAIMTIIITKVVLLANIVLIIVNNEWRLVDKFTLQAFAGEGTLRGERAL